MISSLAEIQGNAQRATGDEEWRARVVTPLRIAVGDLLRAEDVARLPARLNRRTAAAAVAPHSKATLGPTRRGRRLEQETIALDPRLRS